VANTTIQIKRSLATAGPATLANGEVAYSSLTDKLYIGSPAGPVANVIAIGGRQFPGTLTANQALVANSLLGINQIQVANIVALGQITANNSALGSPGNVLLSGGTSGNVYWGTSGAGAAGGSNNQVQINESGSAAGSANFTFNWNTDLNIAGANNFIANGVVLGGLAAGNLIANSTQLTIASNAATTNSSVWANSTTVYHGNGSVSATVNSTVYTGTSWIANNATNLGGTAAAGYQTTAGLSANVLVLSSNNASYLGTVAAAAYVVNTMNGSLTGNVALTGANVTVSGANLTVTATNTYFGGIVNHNANVALAAAGTILIGATVVNSTIYTGTAYTANNATNLGGTAAAGYQTTAGLATNVAALAANNALYLGGVAATSYVQNNMTGSLTGVLNLTGNTTLSGTNTWINGSNCLIASNLNITGANIVATSGVLNIRDINASGNLTITGTTTLLNTQTLAVNDNIVIYADNQANTAVFNDAVDSGWMVQTGNTTNTVYSGVVRVAASSSNTVPFFRMLAVSNTTAPGSTTIAASGTPTTGMLQAYLAPYGAGGLFVVNATNISISGSGAVTLALAANTLSLTTVLPVGSGGTGVNIGGWTGNNVAISVGGAAVSPIVQGGDGTVLQSQAGTIAFAGLDGGSF